MPNRFFEKALVSAGEGLDSDGNFVTVLCGDPGSYSPCPGKRAAMEERVISVALLRALPLGESEDRLFNGKTWELEPLGRQALKKVERRFPDLWARLFRLVSRRVSLTR